MMLAPYGRNISYILVYMKIWANNCSKQNVMKILHLQICIIQNVPEGKVNILGGHSI
jgi:hypothetical protein